MKFPLGAMTVGDILDRGLKILFARLPVFYLINLIVLGPVIVLQMAIPFAIQDLAEGGNQVDPTVVIATLGGIVLVVLLALILQPFGTAAILHIIMQEYKGETASIGQAFSFALTRFLTLLLASLLVGLIVMLGMLLCCIPGIYFAITYAFVGQVVVLERLGAGDALGRSKSLIEGHRWRVFGVLMLIGVANLIVAMMIQTSLGLALPPQEIIPLEGGGQRVQFHPVNQAITSLVSQLVAIVFSTYIAVCTTLLYLDLRIRKEGYDLELAALRGADDGRDERKDFDRDREEYDERDDYRDEDERR
jgi:hypothetical protein